MADQEEFFLGIMVLKDGKWMPHSKFEDGTFGTAMIKAEEVDKLPDFDGAKILRISTNPSSGTKPKEMWVSPRFAAHEKAIEAKRVLQGAKKTQESLAAARRNSVKK